MTKRVIDHTTGKLYPSVQSAANSLGIDHDHILNQARKPIDLRRPILQQKRFSYADRHLGYLKQRVIWCHQTGCAFQNIADASKQLGFSVWRILRQLEREVPHVKGYTFDYFTAGYRGEKRPMCTTPIIHGNKGNRSASKPYRNVTTGERYASATEGAQALCISRAAFYAKVRQGLLTRDN